MWRKYPDKPDDDKEIKKLTALAKKTKDEDAIAAANLLKQKYGNIEQFRKKNKDTKSIEKILVTLYNDCEEKIKDAIVAAKEGAKPWSITPSNTFKAELQNVQDGAESSKLKAWLAATKKVGPMIAAKENRIKCSPMSGGEYHVYLGKANRVYFTPNQKTHTVVLNGIKHR